MNNLKKHIKEIPKYKKIVVIILLSLIMFAGIGFYWWTTTPKYTLNQIKKAYNKHDVDLALKYMDLDAVFEDYWKDLQTNLLEQISTSNNEWEALGVVMGQGMIEKMKPSLKDKMKDQIIETIKDTDGVESPINKAINNPNMYHDGNIVVIEIEGSNIKFNLKKDGRYWKLVAIKGLSDVVNNASNYAEIKSNLSSLRSEAELHYVGNESYRGLCENSRVKSALDKVKEKAGEDAYCKVINDNTYKIYVRISAFDYTKSYCIDSTGFSDELDTTEVQSQSGLCKK